MNWWIDGVGIDKNKNETETHTTSSATASSYDFFKRWPCLHRARLGLLFCKVLHFKTSLGPFLHAPPPISCPPPKIEAESLVDLHIHISLFQQQHFRPRALREGIEIQNSGFFASILWPLIETKNLNRNSPTVSPVSHVSFCQMQSGPWGMSSVTE